MDWWSANAHHPAWIDPTTKQNMLFASNVRTQTNKEGKVYPTLRLATSTYQTYIDNTKVLIHSENAPERYGAFSDVLKYSVIPKMRVQVRAFACRDGRFSFESPPCTGKGTDGAGFTHPGAPAPHRQGDDGEARAKAQAFYNRA